MSQSLFRRAAWIVVVTAVSATASLTSLTAQCDVNESHALLQGDPTTGAGFGDDVALSGNFAVVGNQLLNSYAGAAYFFHFDGTNWVEDLKATDPGGGRFGTSVAVDGNAALVSAPWQNGRQGSVFVYRHDGLQWQYEQTLTASDKGGIDEFGEDVDIRGNLAVVGSSYNTGSGAVYVYRYDGSQWNEEQKLIGSNRGSGDRFTHCAVEGNTILVGAHTNDFLGANAGLAYIFEYDGSQWNETQVLSPSAAAAGDNFGNSVALDGDLAVIGAFNKVTSDSYAGAAFVYRHDGSQWNEDQGLYPTDSGYLFQFGLSVDIEGDHVLVGSPGWDAVWYGTGTAYVFRQDGSRWLEAWKLAPSQAVLGDFIGSGVALDGGRALVVATGAATGGFVGAGACAEYPVDDLALDANADTYQSGDPFLLTTCGGLQSALTLLAAVDVSGIPVFYKLDLGSFDTLGQRAFGGPVPPGLGGLDIQFLSLGFTQPGTLSASNLVSVSFL